MILQTLVVPISSLALVHNKFTDIILLFPLHSSFALTLCITISIMEVVLLIRHIDHALGEIYFNNITIY